MTHEELSASYAIIRHNILTYRSAGVVEVVKGKQHPESTLQKIDAHETHQISTRAGVTSLSRRSEARN